MTIKRESLHSSTLGATACPSMGGAVSLSMEVTGNEAVRGTCLPLTHPSHILVKALIWHQAHFFFPFQSPHAQHEQDRTSQVQRTQWGKEGGR